MKSEMTEVQTSLGLKLVLLLFVLLNIVSDFKCVNANPELKSNPTAKGLKQTGTTSTLSKVDEYLVNMLQQLLNKVDTKSTAAHFFLEPFRMLLGMLLNLLKKHQSGLKESSAFNKQRLVPSKTTNTEIRHQPQRTEANHTGERTHTGEAKQMEMKESIFQSPMATTVNEIQPKLKSEKDLKTAKAEEEAGRSNQPSSNLAGHVEHDQRDTEDHVNQTRNEKHVRSVEDNKRVLGDKRYVGFMNYIMEYMVFDKAAGNGGIVHDYCEDIWDENNSSYSNLPGCADMDVVKDLKTGKFKYIPHQLHYDYQFLVAIESDVDVGEQFGLDYLCQGRKYLNENEESIAETKERLTKAIATIEQRRLKFLPPLMHLAGRYYEEDAEEWALMWNPAGVSYKGQKGAYMVSFIQRGKLFYATSENHHSRYDRNHRLQVTRYPSPTVFMELVDHKESYFGETTEQGIRGKSMKIADDLQSAPVDKRKEAFERQIAQLAGDSNFIGFEERYEELWIDSGVTRTGEKGAMAGSFDIQFGRVFIFSVHHPNEEKLDEEYPVVNFPSAEFFIKFADKKETYFGERDEVEIRKKEAELKAEMVAKQKTKLTRPTEFVV